MKEWFIHGEWEGTLPLVLPYIKLSYPVLLSRTRRTFTTSAKSGLCISHTYAAIKISGRLTRSFKACIRQVSRCCLHPLSLLPQALGLSSDDLPYYCRWCDELRRSTSKSADFCLNQDVGDELVSTFVSYCRVPQFLL